MYAKKSSKARSSLWTIVEAFPGCGGSSRPPCLRKRREPAAKSSTSPEFPRAMLGVQCGFRVFRVKVQQATEEWHDSVAFLSPVLRPWTSTSFLDTAGLMRSSLRGCKGRQCKTRQLVFLVGPQGAGKTTTWRQHPEILAQAGLEGHTVLDGELFYEAHGGHQVLQELEKDACTSHLTLAEEMRTWKRDAASRAGSLGLNILLPVTGTSPMTDAESMAYFQRLGYKISAIFLLVSPQSSSSNAKIRQKQTGRPAMDCFTYSKTCELMEALRKQFDVLYINNDQFQWEVLSSSVGQLRLKMFSEQSSAWRSA